MAGHEDPVQAIDGDAPPDVVAGRGVDEAGGCPPRGSRGVDWIAAIGRLVDLGDPHVAPVGAPVAVPGGIGASTHIHRHAEGLIISRGPGRVQPIEERPVLRAGQAGAQALPAVTGDKDVVRAIGRRGRDQPRAVGVEVRVAARIVPGDDDALVHGVHHQCSNAIVAVAADAQAGHDIEHLRIKRVLLKRGDPPVLPTQRVDRDRARATGRRRMWKLDAWVEVPPRDGDEEQVSGLRVIPHRRGDGGCPHAPQGRTGADGQRLLIARAPDLAHGDGGLSLAVEPRDEGVAPRRGRLDDPAPEGHVGREPARHERIPFVVDDQRVRDGDARARGSARAGLRRVHEMVQPVVRRSLFRRQEGDEAARGRRGSREDHHVRIGVPGDHYGAPMGEGVAVQNSDAVDVALRPRAGPHCLRE